MAHFAHVKDGFVKRIHCLANAEIVNSDGVEDEELGKTFLANLHGYPPAEIIQCSYNATIRGVYPGPGFIYDSELDIFVEPEVVENAAPAEPESAAE